MKILSFQSAVAYGHVGNSAAVFPLQRLGFEVWPVDTVQFSNHPGHGQWRGLALPAAHLGDMVEGLDAVGAIAGADAVLSGYLGQPGSVDAVRTAVSRLRQAKPQAIYLCDPVMGDEGGGLYVDPALPHLFATALLPLADLVTPNRFELSILTGQSTNTLAEASAAARLLLERGPRQVVVTGLDIPGGMVACLAVAAEGAWAVRTPRLAFAITPNGAGDLLSALVLAHTLRGTEFPEALALAVSSLYGILERTRAEGRRELALVAAQDELAAPSRFFPPLAV